MLYRRNLNKDLLPPLNRNAQNEVVFSGLLLTNDACPWISGAGIFIIRFQI